MQKHRPDIIARRRKEKQILFYFLHSIAHSVKITLFIYPVYEIYDTHLLHVFTQSRG